MAFLPSTGGVPKLTASAAPANQDQHDLAKRLSKHTLIELPTELSATCLGVNAYGFRLGSIWEPSKEPPGPTSSICGNATR